MRPRIRTLKPEMWQDEKVGDLSHGARLLFVGLITMADDEGRLRELPAAILGHVFPYDNVAPTKLTRWLGELESSRMVIRYEVAGKRYLAFPHWADHQRVDRANDSTLPAPPVDDFSPDGSSNDSTKTRRTIDDQSRPTRTRASGPIPSRSDPPSNNQGESKPGRAPTKRVDQDVLPAELPTELHPVAQEVHLMLTLLQDQRGGDVPTLRGTGLVIDRYRDRNHMSVANDLKQWVLAGRGQNRRIVDWPRQLGGFFERAPASKPTTSGGQVIPIEGRFSEYDRAAGL